MLQALLVSLSEGSRVPDEVIVIDNDPECSACPEAVPGLPVRIVHAGLGLNVAGARNVGWRSATSDLCVFMDDDSFVEPEAIEHLARVFEDASIGLAGPLIYIGDEGIILSGGIRRSRWTTLTHPILGGQSKLPEASMWPIEDMNDAFAVPRAVLEHVGGLNEELFPFHYEEADLGARIRKLGLQLVVTKNARVRHYGAGLETNPGQTIVRVTAANGAERAKGMALRRIRFHALHYRGLPRLTALGVFIPIWAIVLSTACLFTDAPWRVRLTAARSIMEGTFDGYREVLGRRRRASAKI
jgi:GT2 family glycosyltransferase